jgi:hypothetical protein
MKLLLNMTSATKALKFLLLAGLVGLLLIYTLPWTIRNATSQEYSGIDFHGYWYAGHYMRAGVNPYWALLNNNPNPLYWDPRHPGSGIPSSAGTENGEIESNLKLPIYYLDGVTVKDYPVAQLMIVAPAATAPLGLFMGLFSWFSWFTARSIWLVLNFILAILIPWLGFGLINNFKKISLVDRLILAFAFYNFYGLRQCLTVGQQSVLCLFLLLLAILNKDRWLLAGILLGFGISKYSVGLPIFLLFLLQKRTKAVIVSLVVQLIGALLLLPLYHGSIVDTAKSYLEALSLNYSQRGIHLLARFPNNPIVGYVFVVTILMALVFLVRQMYVHFKDRDISEGAIQLNLINLMIIGIFLAAYHRIHDLPFTIFFFLTFLAVRSEGLELARPEKMWLFSICALLAGLLMIPTFPGRFLSSLQIPDSIITTFASENAMSTFTLVMMFIVSAWLQLRFFTVRTK